MAAQPEPWSLPSPTAPPPVNPPLERERLAFEAVYEAHFSFVWRTTQALGGGEDVDDLVQEVFLVVHRRLAEFEGRSSIRTWLYSIVRRVLSSHRRTQLRKPSLLAPQPEDLEQVAGGGSPDEAYSRGEALRRLDRVLSKLDDDKREVFVLIEIEQMTLAEVAEACGKNANTVASRLRAARALFAKALQESEGESYEHE